MPEEVKNPLAEDANKQAQNIKLSEEQNKKLKGLIGVPLRSANRLMEQLYSDDRFYEAATYTWVGEKDAKKLFLYGVCKEVIKVCIGLMNDQEFLQEAPDGKNPDRMEKIIHGAIADVQTYRIRKMVELLGILILFEKNTKRDEEYRVYLSAENMDLSLARQEDFKELYEKRIVSNTQSSIDNFAKRIQDDMQQLGVTELWFLDKEKLKKQKPSVFKGKKTLFLEALLVANADQRLALGISYGRGYSRTSQSIHPLLGSHDYGKDENNTKHIIANFSHLAIVALHVMHLAYKLAGIEDPEGLTKFMGKNFEKSEAPKTISGLQKEFKLGDLVLTAWEDLAEIVDEHTSKYGYRAYKVKYLSRPPLPEFPEDWLEAQSIIAALLRKDMVRTFYEKHVHYEELPKDVVEIMKEVMKQPDEELMKYAKPFFADLHKAGVLIPMLVKTGFLKKREEAELL
jgi:hypothetical protein